MATDNNIKHFTAADIEKYHQGTLSSKERHDLEKAAMDDPFLADALEGYAVAGPDSAADIAELKKKLAKRVEGAKVIPLLVDKRNHFPWIRAVAIILLIGGAGVLVYLFAFNNNKRSDNGIANLEKTKTTDTKPSDSSNSTGPVTSGKEVTTLQIKPAKLKTETPVNKDVTTSTGSISKNADKTNIVNADSLDHYYTKSANPVNTTSPKGIEGRNSQPVPLKNVKNDPATLDKIAEKKDIAKEGDINKMTANNEREDDKKKVMEQSFVQEDELKKNSTLATNRRAESQNFRNNTTNTFRGQVTDASNVGVPFAKVTNAQDNNAGTYTDARGYFNLTSPDSLLNVQVKSVGFENNSVQLRNNVAQNHVVLQDDRKSLAEVVINNQKPNAAARSRDANMKLEEPEPADGWDNYDTYLTNNLNVPEDFKPQQTRDPSVEVSFEVDKTGEPVNIKVEKSLCNSCDKEAIRIVKEGPKWKRNAKKSRTKVTIPFNNTAQ